MRARLTVFAAIMLLMSPSFGKSGLDKTFVSAQSGPSVLAGFRWVKRPVLVVAGSAEEPQYIEQMRILADAKADLVERDIVVLSVTDPEADGDLRRKFETAEFEVILIGKDGGVKLRRPGPIAADELFSVIDAMPMRRREISEQQSKAECAR